MLETYGVGHTSAANAELIISPCGGAHVRSLGDLAEMALPTPKVKKGRIRVSCSATHRSC
ncbi:hypothetical protein [Streptomyces sp. NPDC001537]